jgi:hypothetical protein
MYVKKFETFQGGLGRRATSQVGGGNEMGRIGLKYII